MLTRDVISLVNMEWNMRGGMLGAAVLLTGMIAGGVYAWGAGFFWPCEALSRLTGNSQCTLVLKLDGQQLERFAVLPDGNVIGVTTEAGRNGLHRLAVFDAETGAVLSDDPIPDYPADQSVSTLLVNHDGSRMLIDSLNGPAALLDRTGAVLGTYRWNIGAFAAFDGKDGRVLADPGFNRRGIPDADRTLVRNINESEEWVEPFVGPHPRGFFSSGVSTVLSPRGTIYAQGLDGARDSGVAGLRIGTVDALDAPGRLLATRLREGCSYYLPRLAFSPDGTKLAAAFSCPPRWGTESSALVVWDMATYKTLARIATEKWWQLPRWTSESSLLVGRYDPDWGRSELFRVTVGE